MLRKFFVFAAIATLFVVVPFTQSFAGKPPKNDAPVVTAFDVEPASASPVPILTFTAEDSDGSVVGYLVTESSSEPSVNDPDWSPTAPSSYTTASVGLVTLYAWAKDNEDAVSNSLSDTVDIPDPADQIIADLLARVADLEAKLAYLTVDQNEINGVAGPHVIFEGVNVHVRSGSGATDDGDLLGDSLDGLGNLIIGYNEDFFVTLEPGDRGGSHNLVMGIDHKFRNYSGLVTGEHNTLAAPFASLISGNVNTAGAWASALVGGWQNSTVNIGSVDSGAFSALVGGRSNSTIDTDAAAIIGGSNNQVFSSLGTIAGGSDNQVLFGISTIAGGQNNIGDGYYTTVSGGHGNTASGGHSTITGGASNEASGQGAWVAGGEFNSAWTLYGSVCGGNGNVANGLYATVSGGKNNEAAGDHSSVSGGIFNRATGQFSSVSGGFQREASGDSDWAAGTLYEDQ